METKEELKTHQKEKKQEKSEDRVVRIVSKDIEGKIKVYAGLTKVKGISWAMSNVICKTLGINKDKKIGSLTDEEIKKISEFMKNPSMHSHLFNRQNDLESGKNRHFLGSELELKTDFDIKRLKKIKSYRGLRHSVGLPVRGQRTKGHFRKNRKKAVGIKKKAKVKQTQK